MKKILGLALLLVLSGAVFVPQAGASCGSAGGGFHRGAHHGHRGGGFGHHGGGCMPVATATRHKKSEPKKSDQDKAKEEQKVAETVAHKTLDRVVHVR